MAQNPEARTLLIESWTLYSIATTFTICRLISRRILLGSWRKLQTDDYIMMFVNICFTMVVVGLNITSSNLANYLPPGEYETLTPDEIKNAVYGSKWVMITEEFQLATLWLTKVCLLILYLQMTSGLPKQHRLVKWVLGYAAFGWVVSEIFYLGVWCRPIQQYWQVPVQNSQCASYYHHIIMVSTFNISTDLIMLLIPIPLLVKAQLPLKRKLVLCAIFSLGVFVILAAILNRYYNFTSGYGSLIYLNWYAGEGATSIMVSNIPHFWPLLATIFGLGSFKSSRSADPGSRNYGMSGKNNTRVSRIRPDEHGYIRSESEERIANAGAARGWENGFYTEQGMGGPAPEQDVELGKMGEAKGYMGASVVVGDVSGRGSKDAARESDGKEDGIMKTVQMHQYADGDDDYPHNNGRGF